MAPKKKSDDEKVKDKLIEDARAVGRAAKSDGIFGSIFGLGRRDWDQTKDEVGKLDAEFEKEEMVNSLKRKLERGDIGVRVMQIGPNGKLTDVSDRVNPKDLRPDQIDAITDNGRATPLGRTPQSREAAIRLLQELLPGVKRSDLRVSAMTSESIRRMEIVLAESDKILEHWKK